MKAHTLFLFTIVLILLSSTKGNTQEFEWVKRIGGDGSDRSFSLAFDNQGNIYATGYFKDVADFDPDSGTFNLSSKGSRDIFILKLDNDGNFIWAKSVGGGSFDVGSSLALDRIGNIYITGSFGGTVDFDPGPNTFNLKSKGEDDIFILKLDNNGDFVWAKSMGNNREDWGNSLTLDNTGNVYVTGFFRKTVDFDPGPGTFNLTSKAFQDIFILKLDTNGNFIWAKSMGQNSGDIGMGLTIDTFSNIYITGYFRGIVDFDPGPDTFNLVSNGYGDIFILKLDTDGNFIWAKSMGGGHFDNGHSLALDNLGNIYATGYLKKTVDFDPDTSIFKLSSKGYEDIFILKLDTNGDFVWAKSMGGSKYDYGISLDVDALGNVYTTGYFMNTVDFDPGTDIFYMSSKEHCAFIQKLDTDGNFIWAKQIKGNKNEGNCLKIDDKNNIYTTGYFYSTADFDPGPDSVYLESFGLRDIFILKLSQCQNSGDTNIVETCHSYQWIDGITYTKSTDSATYTLKNAEGCDSIITLDLTILPSDSTYMYEENCERYFWKDTMLTKSGIYTYDTLNTLGCDSTVFLDLTILEKDTTELAYTACDTFLWENKVYDQSGIYRYDTFNHNGCDSIVLLELTINNSSVSETNATVCDSVFWNGTTYYESGNYRYVTTNDTGCDSIAYLNLNVNRSDTSYNDYSACVKYVWNGVEYTETGTYTYNTNTASGCDSTAILNLTIIDEINRLDTIEICEGDTLNIFGVPVFKEQLLTDTFASYQGCDSIQSFQVIVEPLPQYFIDETICAGDSIFVGGQWIKSSGNYEIRADADFSCDSIISLNLTVLDYAIEQEYFTLCPDDSILVNGVWLKESGVFSFDFESSFGCDSTYIANVKKYDLPQEPTLEIDCDKPEASLYINAENDWKILWSNGDTTQSTTYSGGEKANITLNAEPNCLISYQMDIPELPDISEVPQFKDTLISPGEDIHLTISLDSSWTVLWSPDNIFDCSDCTDINIKTEKSVDVELQLTHSSGCVYYTDFSITVNYDDDINIPNIFSPNNDAINDLWEVGFNNSTSEIIEAAIFSRWGEKVAAWENVPLIKWDGRYKGQDVVSGVYVYFIKYKGQSGREILTYGDVTVMR